MIHKNPSMRPGFVRITFELPSCVWADRISVSGTFNDWDERGVPLVQSRDGVWRATVELSAGRRHEFRYQIDGRWQTDYHADGFTDNIYGSHNSVIDLETARTVVVAERQPSKVADGQPHGSPHLPAPREGLVRGINGERAPEMPRMRPRVAAA